MKNLGTWGEDLAAQILRESGYEIIERNYRMNWGEIDIVAKEGDTVCFVEVKTRESQECGSALEALTPAKQRKLYRLASYYIQENGLNDVAARFDVVAIDLTRPDDPQIDIYKNAFEG